VIRYSSLILLRHLPGLPLPTPAHQPSFDDYQLAGEQSTEQLSLYVVLPEPGRRVAERLLRPTHHKKVGERATQAERKHRTPKHIYLVIRHITESHRCLFDGLTQER